MTIGAAAAAALACTAPAWAQSGETQTVTVTTDNPAITVTNITSFGESVNATGLGTASAQFQRTGDEDGIECESADISIETSDKGYFRPLTNLCETDGLLAVVTTPPSRPAQIPPIDPQLSWSTSSIVLHGEESGADTFLSYGIPETDATVLAAECVAGAGRATVMFQAWDAGAQNDGKVLQAALVGADRVLRYDGHVSVPEGGEAGPLLSINVETFDPLWKAMATDYEGLFIGVAGTDFRAVPTRIGADAITTFVNRCHGS